MELSQWNSFVLLVYANKNSIKTYKGRYHSKKFEWVSFPAWTCEVLFTYDKMVFDGSFFNELLIQGPIFF
jgi:hypothetical protein